LLRLIVLAFPHHDPRRRELLAELHAVPRIERPFWVFEQLEVAVFEGIRGRVSRSNGALLQVITGRQLVLFVRRGRRPRPDPLELPEMTPHKWTARAAELAQTRLHTMARRLPVLIIQALRLAWTASRLDTSVTIALNLAAGILTAVGLLATTGVLTALVDGGPTPDQIRAALPSLALVAVATALGGGCRAVAGWSQARLQSVVQHDVEERMYKLTTAVDLAALDDSDFLDAMQRAEGRGINAAPKAVAHTVDVLSGLTGVIAAACTLGILQPLLLPLLLLTVAPKGLASARAARTRLASMLMRVNIDRHKWVLSDLMADRRHAAEVRSFTMRDFLLREYGRVAAYARDVELDLAGRQTVARIVGDALNGLATAGIYVALGVMLWVGVIPLAVAFTAVLAIRTGRNSLENLFFASDRCHEEGLYFSDYLNFVARARRQITAQGRSTIGDGAADVATAPTVSIPADFQRIIVQNVTFTYPGAKTRSLNEISLEVRHGEIVALVGQNGSGKTTLAKILAGLYQPDSGNVLWDSTPSRDMSPQQLRERIAMIAQDYTHWPMTARQNITMGRITHNDAGVQRAARESGADEVIAQLSHGYETVLDRRFAGGAELSGGQWQRLAIARAFYHDASLLICDEPTATLDPRAERALFERIRTYAHGRTVLLITHRLATVQHADRIYVLDHGRVIEEGDHHRLMALHGLYADLCTLQASAYNPVHDHSPPATSG
jgi:ATP-binding cassette subfamily B protein